MGAVLISRSQPKILRKIKKNLRRYISRISRFLHVCLEINEPQKLGQGSKTFPLFCEQTLFAVGKNGHIGFAKIYWGRLSEIQCKSPQPNK